MRVGYAILLDSSHFCYIYTKTTGGKMTPTHNNTIKYNNKTIGREGVVLKYFLVFRSTYTYKVRKRHGVRTGGTERHSDWPR